MPTPIDWEGHATNLSGVCMLFAALCVAYDGLTHKKPTNLRIVLKVLASTSFLLAAVCWNAIGDRNCPPSRTYNEALECTMLTTAFTARSYIFAGLLLCFAGDVLLLFQELFIGGLVAFLFGHVAFIALFATRPLDLIRFAVYALVPQVLFFLWVRSWLFPRTGKMHIPVVAYLVVINAMVGCAVAGGHGALAIIAAILFLLSDVGVAKDKFVGYSLGNRMTLLIYFASVLMFAFMLSDPDV